MKRQFSPEQDEGGRAWIPYVVLVLTLLLTALTAYYVAQKAEEKGRLLFESAGGHLTYILLGGLFTSVVLFWLTRAQARARAAAKRAAAKLRQSEERFRTLIEQSPLSTQVFSPDGRTIQVNRAWEELWGVTLETVARAAGLGFLPVQHEQYDFVVPRARAERAAVAAFKALLRQPGTREALMRLGMTP